MIPVTKPFCPPIALYKEYIDEIWERNWLTNNGPLVMKLENNLSEYLNVKNILYTTNGTISLQLAIKALKLNNEIITTPFSYVATTTSIVWEGCKPVFVDIDPESFNINPKLIESKITKNTQAILATHCFGNPCDIELIQNLADKYNLKIIYDAAHCFGTLYNNISVLEYGDISSISFHATKLYHTIEGGALVTKNHELFNSLNYMRNFGHNGYEKFNGIGINGKNSEFHAAMGLCNLKFIDEILDTRKQQSLFYDNLLEAFNIQKQKIHSKAKYNYSYYPVIFESENFTLKVKEELEKNKIFPRRYFYPSLSSLDYVDKYETPVSNDISSRILCLPLYFDLKKEEQENISNIIKKCFKN
jgi:dTDP-4-amino-4,6-dideoxygalactose transaminase